MNEYRHNSKHASYTTNGTNYGTIMTGHVLCLMLKVLYVLNPSLANPSRSFLGSELKDACWIRKVFALES